MMESDSLVLLLSFTLLLTLVLGLARALRGPTLEDRMLSFQLVGTGGVARLLLLADLAALAAAAVTRREVSHGWVDRPRFPGRRS